MKRWISPPVGDGCLSNGWNVRLHWPYAIFGVVDANVVHIPTGVVTSIPANESARRVAVGFHEDASGLSVGVLFDSGELVRVSLADFSVERPTSLTLADFSEPREHTAAPPVPGAEWQGMAEVVVRRGERWLWIPCAGGHNEQVFMVGRREGDPSDGGYVIVEMPCATGETLNKGGGPLAQYFDASDTWALTGMARGNHGTPDYQDGQLHIVWELAASRPRTRLIDNLTPFAYPSRLPDQVPAVWTYGDVIEGTVGGGRNPVVPNRQGIGLWSARDAQGGWGIEGEPWLSRNKPSLGMWISPHESHQRLREFPTDARFEQLIQGYEVNPIRDELISMRQAAIAAGSFEFGSIEERIATYRCKTRGENLTVYSDHQTSIDLEANAWPPFILAIRERLGLLGVNWPPNGATPDQNTTVGYWDLLDKYDALKAQGVAVIAGISAYPRGIAGWALEDVFAEMAALGPIAVAVARYTQLGHWSMTEVARQRDWAVRQAVRFNALVIDEFGVGGRGDLAEFETWGNASTRDLISRSRFDVSHWPRTAIIAPPPPVVPTKPVEPPAPPIKPTKPPVVLKDDHTKRNASIAIAIGSGIASLWSWIRRRKKNDGR